MSIDTIYLCARSKNDANLRLKADPGLMAALVVHLDTVPCIVRNMPLGTVVKIYEKHDFAGTPIAKSYGNIAKRSSGEVYIK